MANLFGLLAKVVAENPEAAKALAEKAPEVAKVVTDAVQDFGTKAFAACNESKKNRQELDKAVLDALLREYENPNRTAEEKKEMLSEIKEFMDGVYMNDEKDKHHELKILEFAAGAIFGGPIFLAGYAGVKAYQHIKLPSKERGLFVA